MRKGEIIKGYRIIEDFSVAGGQSKISKAQKGDKIYFIKEFLRPKYPLAESPGSPKGKEKKKKRCAAFEKHHRDINTKISGKCSIGGNLVFAIDFFRHGTVYYKINELIDMSSLSPKDISGLPMEKRILIMKTVSHSLNILHKLEIVHGDIKPDNVLIKKKEKAGNYVAKLIDFDDSYFSGKPPVKVDDIVGDQVYYSPELGDYLINESDKKDILTTQSDVFALGVLFSQYLVGEPPIIKDKYEYCWQSVLNGDDIHIKEKGLSSDLCSLINSMFLLKKDDRPSVEEVFKSLKSLGKKGDIPLSDKRKSEEKKEKKGTLRISKDFRKKEAKEPAEKIKPKESKSKLRGTLLKRK